MTRRHIAIAAVAAALATLLAFFPGLSGPFTLDDLGVLQPIQRWLSGSTSYIEAALAGPAGVLGRPVSMLTLMSNAALGGTDPFGFKLVNLLVHLFNGALALLLLDRLTRRASPGARWLAVLVVAIWWLHPWQVSTVLYVSQRMALLAATSQLAAVLLWLEGREALATESRRATWLLFAAFPTVVALGFLAKESAVLAPLLCATIELTVFSRERREPRVRLFFGLFLLLPLAVGFVALFAAPQLLGNFDTREFSMAQRLLTQPRVLVDYLTGWFWPSASHLGMFRDGYAHSSGLLAPPSTLGSMLLLVALFATAWLTRLRQPLAALGVIWFFAGHALEAGPLNLEPYFEHRNYLPSLGLTLSAVVLVSLAARRAAGMLLGAAAVALLLALAVLTHQRSERWADFDSLLASEGPPAGEVSRRLELTRAIRAAEIGGAQAGLEALATLRGGNPGDRAAAALWSARYACLAEGRLDASRRAALATHIPPVLTHNHVTALDQLAALALSGRCQGLDAALVLALGESWKLNVQQRPRGVPAKLDRVLEIVAIRSGQQERQP